MKSVAIISAYLLDLAFGDPEWFPHPVRGMGKLINLLEKLLNTKSTPWVRRIKGVILTFVVVGVSALFAYLFIEFSKRINPFLGILAWVYLGYAALSIKDLQVKTRIIAEALKKDKIFEARKELSKVVGRDTQDLEKDRIAVATIESIAENTNDGIVAPLFYLILGGPVLAMVYKSINTLDSMVGYKNEKYLYFGWFSAKIDDIVNFIPARISGFLISISSVFSGKKIKDSFRIMLRDGKKHPSPNSGVSEAAMSGALGIRLGGPSTYQGRVLNKPYIGEDKETIKSSLINEALSISFITSILMLSLGVLVRWVI